MSIANCHRASNDAVSELKDGMLTRGSHKSSESRLKTWDKLSKLAQIEQVRFSADDMTRIIAILNKAGYRSAAAYVTDA